MSSKKKLIVVCGPTASGKTSLGIELANHLNTVIISADSRQFYKELSIGTAKPTENELALAKHYFIGNISIHDYYNVSKFEEEVLSLLEELFITHNEVVMVGGSGLYIRAVCEGFSEMPTISQKVRDEVNGFYDEFGLQALQDKVKEVDPEYWAIVDTMNPARLKRALEMFWETGAKFSSMRDGGVKERPFEIIKIGIELDREVLYQRINKRVDMMMEEGLLEEAKAFFSYEHLTALQTVGYVELFDFFHGKCSLEESVEDIKQHTRNYAKRQITWFKKEKNLKWVAPNLNLMLELI